MSPKEKAKQEAAANFQAAAKSLVEATDALNYDDHDTAKLFADELSEALDREVKVTL